MDLSLFDYAFPKELVAQRPPQEREASRMMVVNRSKQSFENRSFTDLLTYLEPGDLLIFNNALADLVDFGGKLVPALPPYIKRKKADDFTPEDFDRYKTVYGKVPGSKAAPTAGFHFSENILKKISEKGIETAFVTLHVSYDTYKPIRDQNILQHPMHGEDFVMPEETATKIKEAKSKGRRVICVGTTAVRVVESWAAGFKDKTQLFITPGYTFKIVDAMVTNFHRPKSTVLVMVSAFAGREFILKAYEEAVREHYKLFSYGDCMLIL